MRRTRDAPDNVAVLRRIDRFLDAMVAHGAQVVDASRFTCFLGRSWPYYARPKPMPTPVRLADVAQAAHVLQSHDAPVAFEWIEQTAPGMSQAVEEYGLAVTRRPLMMATQLQAAQGPAKIVAPGSSQVRQARAVGEVSFGAAHSDPRSRDARVVTDEVLANLNRRLADGTTVTVIVEEQEGVVGTATLQSVDGVGEIVGVAVLSSHRRRGIGSMLTAALVERGRDLGLEVIFLSAGTQGAQALYCGLGFEEIATACSTE